MGIPIQSSLACLQHLWMMNSNKMAFATASVLALAAVILPVSEKEKSLCRVQASRPHISTFFAERNGLNALKINAYSVCDRPHSRVTITVELWKEETVFKKRIKKTIARHVGFLAPNERFYNQKTFVVCKTSRKSLYYGVAYAKALIDGEWHFATHKIAISIPINCGT